MRNKTGIEFLNITNNARAHCLQKGVKWFLHQLSPELLAADANRAFSSILELDTSWRRVVRFAPRPLYVSWKELLISIG
jgi:hypothetical protein